MVRPTLRSALAALAMLVCLVPASLAWAADSAAPQTPPAPRKPASRPAQVPTPFTAPSDAAPPPAAEPLTGAPLQRAEQLYGRGAYADAVDLLRGSTADGSVTGNDVREANLMVARCMVRLGSARVGREILKGVLRQSPGYRPPDGVWQADEIQGYMDARRDLAEEQAANAARQGGREWREPTSLSLAFGIRNRTNHDIEDLVSRHGGLELQDRLEWGGGVRIPTGRRFALEIEALALEQTSRALYPFFSFDARVRAVPVVANLYWKWAEDEGGATQLFVGAGPIVAGELELTARGSLNNGALLAREGGLYAHLGVERDVRLGARYGLSLRALGRMSRTNELDLGPTFGPAGALDVNGRNISFRGFALHAAVRAYIGS
jgi:hypothetical protein